MEGDAERGSGRADSLGVQGGWRVRLRSWDARGRGRVLGAGVLLGRDRVLTCAHVVEEDPVTHRRPERVQVELLRADRPRRVQRFTATVMDGNWRPRFGDDQGDLALLALVRPVPEASPVTLFRAAGWYGAPVGIHGFPAGSDADPWPTGTHLGPGGPSEEWDRIDLDGGGDRALAGFDGAGVVLRNTDRVIGVLVRADAEGRRAYMIPTSIVAACLPGVAPFVHGARTMSDEDAVPAEYALTARPHALQRTVLRWLHGDPADPDAWDVEVLFIGSDDERARQALRLLLTLADRERAPRFSADPARHVIPRRRSGDDHGPADARGHIDGPTDGHLRIDGHGTGNGVPRRAAPATGATARGGARDGRRLSGAPLLGQAGITPRVGSISLVLNLAGTSLDPPGTASVREAMEGLNEALAHAGSYAVRPAIAVLGADRSTSAPYATAHRLHQLALAGARLLIVLAGPDSAFADEMARLLPPTRAADWLDRIGRRIGALAEAEIFVSHVYDTVEAHIAGHLRPPEYTSEARLWQALLAMDTERHGDRPAPATYLERLSHGEQRIERRLLRVEQAGWALEALSEERDRLIGMLHAYRARLVRHGLGEHPGAVGPYRTAHRHLYGGPVTLEAAARAVEEFVTVVRRLTGRRPEDDEEGGR
ncbi:trypsin-like serine peptidase [Streptomyces sp. NPDC002004]